MAIESDVIVIGGGLAGLTSALVVAQQDVDVRLLSYGQSTLRNASGLIDILGYTPASDGPVIDPYEAIPELSTGHPYRTVGVTQTREAMQFFDTVVPQYHGDHTDTNALLPTHGGTVKPTARYPDSARAGLASDTRDMILIGFESLADFHAPHVAAHLDAAGVPFAVRGVTIQFPGEYPPNTAVTRYAKLLDANADVTIRGHQRPLRAALADRVKSHLRGEQRVGFPAILGDDATATVRETLAEQLDAAIFEVPMGPPSLPGLRLEDTLFTALDAAGGHIETGNPVVGYHGSDHIEQVVVDKNNARIPYRADQYILATGGLVGKGVESDRDGVHEPIFDCHIPHPDSRYDWAEKSVFGDHTFARFGVVTDTDLRPVAADGCPEFANLRAAGAVLGGYDFAAEKSGSGVSIATGYAAGQAVTQELS